MGGRGSGRVWYLEAKDTTDSYRWVDVRQWSREGLLRSGLTFTWHWLRDDEAIATIMVKTERGCVFLSYSGRTYEEEWEKMNYSVALDWTACNFGGRRPWFLCPAIGCGRRVAILYGGKVFACRQCHRLAYRSQREILEDRAARRADRIRKRLDWEPGILNGTGFKPKGMHWKTYSRLCDKHNTYRDVSIRSFVARVNLLGSSIGD